MARDNWSYGMVETEFKEMDMPDYDEYMTLVNNNLADPGRIEPLYSGKIAGKDEYWTFVRHKIEPRAFEDICRNKLPNVRSYSHCYQFKRFRGELMTKVMGGRHRYIGIAKVPEAEEFDESELMGLMKKIEEHTPLHVAWVSRTHRRDRRNIFFLLSGDINPEELMDHVENIKDKLHAESSDIRHIQKMGHHKSHKRTQAEKEKSIKEHMPEDYADHEWLKEYDYYRWSR